MRNRLEKLVWVGAILTFFVPLLVPYHSYIFPFIVPKIIWFRMIAMGMMVTYALLLAINYERYKIRLTPLTGAVLAYLISLVLSTFMGVDWYRSFWDGHERMLGLFTLLHYIGYYLVLTHLGFDRVKWQWLFRCFLGGASLVMLVALCQKIDPMYLLNNGSPRVAGTLGNSIYLGGYGLFVIFASAYAGFREKQLGWRVYAAVTGLLGVCGLLFSGTRGTLVGLVAGLIMTAVTAAITSAPKSTVRKAVLGGSAAALVLGIVLIIFRTTPFVRSIPAVGSLLNTSVAEGTSGTRLMSWQIAVEAWQEKPVFGWGVNNFFYAFNEHYRPEFLQFGWGETWFDNAHNIVVNTLATQGVVGVITYLGVFGAAGWALIVGYRTKRVDQLTLLFGVGFLTAHLTQAVFVFENPTSYLYFFFSLAYLNAMARPALEKMPGDKSLSTPLMVTAGVVFVLVAYAADWRAASANKIALQALQALYSDPKSAVELYNKAISTGSPHSDDIRADFARVADQLVPQYIQAKRQDLALLIFTAAYEGVKQNRVLHPYDIRNQISQAQLALTGAQLENKPSYLLEAQEALEDALKKSPRRQQVQYLLAGVYGRTGQHQLAVNVLKDAWDANKKIEGNWWRLALAYNDNGQKDEAKALFIELDKAGVTLSPEGEQVKAMILGQ